MVHGGQNKDKEVGKKPGKTGAMEKDLVKGVNNMPGSEFQRIARGFTKDAGGSGGSGGSGGTGGSVCSITCG